MKKKLFKLLGLLLAIICAFSVVACTVDDPNNEDKPVDSYKTQLYIGLVPSGWGNSWMYKHIERFEEMYKDYEFETGKKGVQVHLDDATYGNVIAANLPTSRYKLVFTTDVNYFDLVNKGLIEDITDIVDEEFDDVDAQGNTVKTSIKDKFLDPEGVEDAMYYDGKIYALPLMGGTQGISYDRDLFEELGAFFVAADPENDDYTAYYTTNSDGSKNYTFAKPSQATLSMGRDGIPGTYDDGLPATYEQFYALMEWLADMSITPITWTGMYPSYTTQFAAEIWANNEGPENMKMNSTFRGTATDLVESVTDVSPTNRDGTVHYMAPVEITDDNGYMLNYQAGKYYALSFIDNIMNIMETKDPNGYDLMNKASIDHIGAQDNFLKSVIDSENVAGARRIAMFVDGNYWENEATATFNAMGPGYGKMDRKIGVMPIPHPTEEGAGNLTVGVGTASLMMMNKTATETEKKVIRKFLQFLVRRDSLVEFEQITSMIRPYEYEMTDEEISKMSYYGQCYYNMTHNDTTEWYTAASSNPIYRKNYSNFSAVSSNNWRTVEYGDILREALRTTDAVTYFNSLKAFFTQSFWNGIK